MYRTLALLLCVLSLATVACSNDDSSITGVNTSYNSPSYHQYSAGGYAYIDTEVREGGNSPVIVTDTVRTQK